ncbi:MAG: ATP-binding cassette domain-containing protein [Oscillospiraceae bacterium]
MKPVIRLEHIEKVFHDGKDDFEALRDVSLDVEEGGIFGIIGLSGAGKSTPVRCLNLLERPTSGKVFLHGQDMTALSPAEIRRCRQKIGMVFQHFNLPHAAHCPRQRLLPAGDRRHEQEGRKKARDGGFETCRHCR